MCSSLRLAFYYKCASIAQEKLVAIGIDPDARWLSVVACGIRIGKGGLNNVEPVIRIVAKLD